MKLRAVDALFFLGMAIYAQVSGYPGWIGPVAASIAAILYLSINFERVDK